MPRVIPIPPLKSTANCALLLMSRNRKKKHTFRKSSFSKINPSTVIPPVVSLSPTMSPELLRLTMYHFLWEHGHHEARIKLAMYNIMNMDICPPHLISRWAFHYSEPWATGVCRSDCCALEPRIKLAFRKWNLVNMDTWARRTRFLSQSSFAPSSEQLSLSVANPAHWTSAFRLCCLFDR